jgi:hypothetical protein
MKWICEKCDKKICELDTDVRNPIRWNSCPFAANREANWLTLEKGGKG